ncbi:hypothetical protein HME9302_00205 [Alteripontixanthobacter maritimus]|uniref:G domain-containing protein n=1 Tax=Alteripontixanthobacter maritimus TaxID=2161824 RepID=A0A369Q9R1_9SPHN|nr:GTPase domain-containing protein [Alteripontixanthobacter maritimus]RDC59028.1 hypothetical protein HME9302_00205 [Alteripontixanthobacter maritimus]
MTELHTEGTAINLSLISHTNAGKTTLARTLLGRDVGEVRDAAHVTDLASGYVLVQSGADTLMLWDTPGFGDTARLLDRLRLSGNPIGWMLTQVWDRFRERPLWSSQQAVKNAREQADVILYLVNAAEDPAAASYVALEMDVLEWIGKPVLLLLNQMGPPREDTTDEIMRWQNHLGERGIVAGALPMDAFARVWVQEGALLDTVAPLLPPEKAGAMAALKAEWEDINLARFRASMTALAEALAQAATDRESVRGSTWRDELGSALRAGRGERPETREAMTKLAERLAAGTHSSTDALIQLHGLSGKASRKVLERIAADYRSEEKTPEGAAALLGGLASGAVTGLAADLAAGGLTLGGGMIVGGILGALGGGGLARGINMAKGEDGSVVRWSDDFFADLVGTSLLRYLAVAHFGRGRGEWEEGEHPAFWHDRVRAVVEKHRETIDRLHRDARRMDAGELAGGIDDVMRQMGAQLLIDLYPKAAQVLSR